MKSNHRIFLSRTLALEKAAIPKIIRIIKAFRADFIRDLKDNGVNVAKGNLQQLMPSEELSRAIQAIYKRAGLMGARMTYGEVRIAAVEQKAGFGRNEQWIRDVIDFLRLHLIKFVQDITETMRGDIVKILEKATEEGWSIETTVKQLQAEGLIQARARVIARTEIIRAANVGHSVAAQSLPYEVDKKWSAAADHRTRHSHRFIHNHQTDEGGTFRVPIYKGDKATGLFDEMQYPGDPTASAANTINCRCRVVYIPKRDANGRLMMKPRNQAPIVQMRKPYSSYTDAQIAAELKANITIGVE